MKNIIVFTVILSVILIAAYGYAERYNVSGYDQEGNYWRGTVDVDKFGSGTGHVYNEDGDEQYLYSVDKIIVL